MGFLAWAMMGLAIWHFTIWLPDRYWGGIVEAFIGSLIGAVLVGLLIHGFSIPGPHATHLITAIEGIPGSLLGIGLIYAEGTRRERTLMSRCSRIRRQIASGATLGEASARWPPSRG